jgi:integrase
MEESTMKQQAAITRVRLQKGRHLVKRGETWYLETCQGGFQERRSLGTGDLQEATLRAAQGGEPVLESVLKPKAPATLTLGKAIEEYEEWYAKNRRDTERSKAPLQAFLDLLGEDKDTRSITRDDVQRFVDNRVDGRSPITVRSDFARVRAFLYWLARRKDAADMGSCRGIDKPKEDGTTREAPSPDKVKAVIAKLRSHRWLGDFTTVLAETGMRPSELLGVRGTDFREKLLSIVPWEGRELKSKWSKRVIELNEAAAEIFRKRKETMFNKALPVFANETGEVYAEHSAYHAFQDTLGGGKLKKPPEALEMTLYDFRHFFCSEHAAPGPQHMEIEALAAYIGHSPASTQTLLRWYADQRALRRGAPAQLVGDAKEGKVILLGKGKAEAE